MVGGVTISHWLIGIVSAYFLGWEHGLHSGIRRNLKCILEPTVNDGCAIRTHVNDNQCNSIYPGVENMIPFEHILETKVSAPNVFLPKENKLRTLSLKELVRALDLTLFLKLS